MTLSRGDIDRAFQNSLGRAPSQQDEGAFLFASQNGDASDIQLYAAISNSREADLIADPVVRFYQAAFGRVPDQPGLDNASDYVRQFGATPETYQKLADMFVQSPEFQARFGSGTTVDAGYVQALYSTILNREPSAAEIQGYVTGANGYDTRGEVLYAIAQSPEAIQLTDNAVNGFLLHAAEGDAVYTGPLIPDTLAPRVEISFADNSLEAGQRTQVTFDFTEAVTGFDLTDVTSTRGSLSALIQSQTDPTVYTATFIASQAEGTGTIELTGTYTDAAGNIGRAGQADLTVAPPPAINRAPVAVNDSYAVNEDTALNVLSRGVLANDTDADSNALTAVLVTGPTNGTLTLNTDGSFSYQANANYNGQDSFTYRANDGSADSAPATVNLTINAVNDAPIANPDSYITNEDTPLIISAGRGVLANDTDADGDALAISSYIQPQHGTLTANPDGSFNYVPNANYSGPDSFTYRAYDGTDYSISPATVSLTVSPVYDPPVYTIAVSPASIDEGNTGAGNVMTYTVTRTGDLDQPGSVAITLSGTANGSDYTTNLSNGAVTFAVGAPSVSFTVTSTPDAAFEAGETVIATLGTITGGGTLGATSTATGTIANDDSTQFRVNTTTGDSQEYPSVAMDAEGNFVVTWTSDGQDGSSNGVYGQRYDTTGTVEGTEFRVNTTTAGDQDEAAVAMSADGRYVVTWTSPPPNGSSSDIEIYGQRYDASGVRQGSEFQVNTTTLNEQDRSSVAIDASGNFVVTWTSLFQDGSDRGIYGQRYDASGQRQGSEFLVNTTTASEQYNSSVAKDASGNFVVTWTSLLQDGSGRGVYGQRYNTLGERQGAEFQVNTTTAEEQDHSSVAMDADGDFVVTWSSDIDLSNNENFDIIGQRYNALGERQGSQFRVNTTTAAAQEYSSVAMDAAGNFVVTWTSTGQDGSDRGVYGQRYNAAGQRQGVEFRLNATTSGDQDADTRYAGNTVALSNDGGLLVGVWDGPGNSSDVYVGLFA